MKGDELDFPWKDQFIFREKLIWISFHYSLAIQTIRVNINNLA